MHLYNIPIILCGLIYKLKFNPNSILLMKSFCYILTLKSLFKYKRNYRKMLKQNLDNKIYYAIRIDHNLEIVLGYFIIGILINNIT